MAAHEGAAGIDFGSRFDRSNPTIPSPSEQHFARAVYAGEALDILLIRHLHDCGPRPVAELLTEIAALDPDVAALIHDRLEAYTAVDPSVYRLTGDDWRRPM